MTVNHRLNLFGHLFLADDDARFAESGNAGVADMISALRWVRTNIGAFGGNPDNVTIFGQSGGGSKVVALMTAQSARGLFAKAIAQSCSGCLHFAEPEEAARLTNQLAGAIGLRRATGEALQSVPESILLRAWRDLRLPFRPVRDGRIFTHHPFEGEAAGDGRDVPFMFGNVASEARWTMASNLENFTLSRQEVLRRLGRFLQLPDAQALDILTAYESASPSASPSDILANVASDYIYVRNSRRAGMLQSMLSSANVYAYLFDWTTPVLDGMLRAPHAIELPFIFGTTDVAAPLVGQGGDLAGLTRMMMNSWVTFARTGIPGHEHSPRWPAFSREKRKVMILGDEPRVRRDPGAFPRSVLGPLPFFDYYMPVNYASP